MKFTSDYFIGSSLFTLGCLSYTIDALKQEKINKLVLIGCVCFDLGCLFFIKDSLS